MNDHPAKMLSRLDAAEPSAVDGPRLSLRGVGRETGDRWILEHIDLDIGNEYVAVVGRSGSGKTTLLRTIAGFDETSTGRVVLDGVDITAQGAAERGVGVVFQSFALFPHLNVFENVAFGLRYGRQGTTKEEVTAAVRRALELVDLVGYGDRQIQQLSGGQKQRVALARSLVIEPRLLLLDEPLGALDAGLRARMQRELVELQRRLQIPFVHLTGDDREALSVGDRIVVLDSGRIEQVGNPSQILSMPRSERVANVFDRFNIVRSAELERGPLSGGPPDSLLCFPIQSTTVGEGSLNHADPLDRCAIEATFITTELLDGKIRGFFATRGGTILQTERDVDEKSGDLEAHANYRLTWAADVTRIFDPQTGQNEARVSSTPGAVSNLRTARPGLLALPAVLWMTLFLLVPLATIVVVSFWTQTTFAIRPVPTLSNWVTFLTTRTYLEATLTTLKLWAIVLAASFVLSVPVAIFIGLFVKSRAIQTALIVACIIPFWTSFLIRVLAWRPMLGREGAVNEILQWLHLTSGPLDQLLFSELSVLIGMTQVYSVFVVGPVAYMVSRIDRNLIEAARDLGANFSAVLFRIVLPLSKPGLLVGAIFVSVMVLGEFATSAALSGRQVNLLGNVIVNQVGTLRWALAAVVGCVLTVLAMLVVGVLFKVATIKREVR